MTHTISDLTRPRMSDTDSGKPLNIGTGFTATSFHHTRFDGLMDPLIMVDHFVTTERTFEAHAHAGLSAVTIMFTDSTGRFRNKDSLGYDVDLMPGDLYWLKAAGGAIHDEAVRPGGRTHALQVFVNLPAAMKHDVPEALHVSASSMPLLKGKNAQARLVLGHSGGVQGAAAPALPMTILDVSLAKGGQFTHVAGPEQSMWVYAARGDVTLGLPDHRIELQAGQSIALQGAEALTLDAAGAAHAVILQGSPLREDFVQRGPYAMSTSDELDAVDADYRAGRLGRLD